MHTIQISDGLKQLVDRLVAQGFAASTAQVIEEAVLRCASEAEALDEPTLAAVEAGLADMREGRYTTIDGPEARQAFWDEVMHDVGTSVADMRRKSVSTDK